jgi:hypothetical protein
MKSTAPICQYIQQFPNRYQDILITYGHNDWMDYQDTLKFLSDNSIDIPY